jgi:hypothetical protein
LSSKKQIEAMGRGQITLQTLFAQDTLPRTFSPPLKDVATHRAQAHESWVMKRSLSFHLQSKISHGKASSFGYVPIDEDHPHHAMDVVDQDNVIKDWQPSKALKGSGAKIERCKSNNIIMSYGVQVTKGAEKLWFPQ